MAEHFPRLRTAQQLSSKPLEQTMGVTNQRMTPALLLVSAVWRIWRVVYNSIYIYSVFGCKGWFWAGA